MGLISERKGINNWLSKQGVKSNERQQELLSLFKKETSISFYRTYTSNTFGLRNQTQAHKRFQRFVRWFKDNNIR